MSCKRTKNNDICHRITADAVTAVDAPDNLTRSKRSRQYVVVAVQHAGIGIDGHAAHGVVNPWCNLNGVERPFVDWRTQRGGTSKVVIVLFLHKDVVAFQRCQNWW